MGGYIKITAREENNKILVEIKDNGVGISADDIPHIFDDFYVGATKPEEKEKWSRISHH
jgi:signal transduction histidine kinase